MAATIPLMSIPKPTIGKVPYLYSKSTGERLYTATPTADSSPHTSTVSGKLSIDKPSFPIRHMVPTNASITEIISPLDGRLP